MNEKIEAAKKYLGDKHILAKNSTYDPTQPPVLTQWQNKKLIEKTKETLQ